jgi:hypothetical protein
MIEPILKDKMESRKSKTIQSNSAPMMVTSAAAAATSDDSLLDHLLNVTQGEFHFVLSFVISSYLKIRTRYEVDCGRGYQVGYLS